MRVSNLLLPDIGELLHSDPRAIREIAEEIHPADLADLAANLPEEEQTILLSNLTDEQAGQVLDELELTHRVEIFSRLPVDLAARLANSMSADERADLFAQLSEELRAAVLPRMESDERTDVKKLLAFPPASAGGLMTTEFFTLPSNVTAAESIEYIRKAAEGMETIHEVFVVDPNGVYIGAVQLEALVLSRGNTPARDLIDPTSIISVRPLTDQEEVARMFSKYDLFALPVTDEDGRILGIITVDDVVDVLEEESTEDIQKMGAVEPLEAPYLETAFSEILRKRASWLVVLFVGQFFTSTAMRVYESELAMALELALFIPLVISSGGNSGSQSSTLIIRAMSLGQVQAEDWFKIILRECAMGLLLGLLLGVIGLGRALWMRTELPIALTVGASVVGIVMSGSIFGALLPMALRRVGLDPAVSSAPLISSLVDVSGLVLYFTVARFFLIPRLLP